MIAAPRPAPRPAGVARIAVVVLTHDRKSEVLHTLQKLVALPEAPPVCVVDNGSRDGTALAVARHFPQVELVRLERNIGAAGRNAGVRRMACDYVAFCDDDTWWAPGALTRAADLLDAHPSLAAITARILVGPEQREDPTCALMAASSIPAPPGLPGTGVLGFMAGACVMRRRVFLLAGGYEPRLMIGGEERLLGLDLLAADWALGYVPELVVHHYPSGQRDAAQRRRLLLRNALWCAWLRRPADRAWRETRRGLRAALREPHLLRGLAAAFGGMAWVLRRRRVIPAGLDRALRALEEVV